MKRTIQVSTSYGTIEIVNLKRVWINRFCGSYNLMYQDDIYEYNCIYWTNRSNHNYDELKIKLIEAYNSGATIVEL